jgi:hypothetical protein
MPLIQDIKNDVKAAKKMRIPWWGLLCIGIGALPIYWLFDHFGRLNIALPTLNCILVLGFMLVLKWKLRRHAWFWITMAVLATLHVPLVLLVPWTSRWVPALVIAVIDSADFCLMLWIISIIGKLVQGAKPMKYDRPRS